MGFAHGFHPDSMAAYYAEQEIDPQFDEEQPQPKICNRCGKTDLHWEETQDGWRLFDENDVMHSCHFKPSDLSNLKRK